VDDTVSLAGKPTRFIVHCRMATMPFASEHFGEGEAFAAAHGIPNLADH